MALIRAGVNGAGVNGAIFPKIKCKTGVNFHDVKMDKKSYFCIFYAIDNLSSPSGIQKECIEIYYLYPRNESKYHYGFFSRFQIH